VNFANQFLREASNLLRTSAQQTTFTRRRYPTNRKPALKSAPLYLMDRVPPRGVKAPSIEPAQ
jgi:hypothetical protein